jgi:hypothetical protein
VRSAGPEPANTGERSTRVAERFDSTCELAALTRESNARQTVKQVMDFLSIRLIFSINDVAQVVQPAPI